MLEVNHKSKLTDLKCDYYQFYLNPFTTRTIRKTIHNGLNGFIHEVKVIAGYPDTSKWQLYGNYVDFRKVTASLLFLTVGGWLHLHQFNCGIVQGNTLSLNVNICSSPIVSTTPHLSSYTAHRVLLKLQGKNITSSRKMKH